MSTTLCPDGESGAWRRGVTFQRTRSGSWQSWEAHLVVYLTALSHCVPTPSMQSLLSTGLNQRPLLIQEPVSQVRFLCPFRPISPSLWETLTLETFQEAFLRGNRTHGDWKGPGGRGKSGMIAPSFFLPSSPAKPDLQRALVPVVKELVPVSRPDWGQLCLAPLHPQPLRCAPRQSRKGG